MGVGRTIPDEALTFYQGNILVELVLRQVSRDGDIVEPEKSLTFIPYAAGG